MSQPSKRRNSDGNEADPNQRRGQSGGQAGRGGQWEAIERIEQDEGEHHQSRQEDDGRTDHTVNAHTDPAAAKPTDGTSA